MVQAFGYAFYGRGVLVGQVVRVAWAGFVGVENDVGVAGLDAVESGRWVGVGRIADGKVLM